MNEFILSLTRDELIDLKYALLDYRTSRASCVSSGRLDQLLALSRKLDVVFNS